MAQANSDNPGINGTLDKFFSVFSANSGAGTYKNVDILINEVFCVNNPAAKIPCVGIATHGPQFPDAGAVRGLYNQIFTSFPDIWWGASTSAPAQTTAPVPPVPPAPRLYSNDAGHPPTVGVQTTMVGTFKQLWFQDAQRYSLPLSGIPVSTPPKATNTPSFAVFVFGAQDPTRVSRVSFYMDRYNQGRDLQPIHPNNFDTDIRALLQHAQDRANTERLLELNQEAKSDLSRLIEALDGREKKR
jgi:hypothetical protein